MNLVSGLKKMVSWCKSSSKERDLLFTAIISFAVLTLLPEFSFAEAGSSLSVGGIMNYMKSDKIGGFTIKAVLIVMFVVHFFEKIFISFWKGEGSIGPEAVKSVALFAIIMTYDDIVGSAIKALG